MLPIVENLQALMQYLTVYQTLVTELWSYMPQVLMVASIAWWTVMMAIAWTGYFVAHYRYRSLERSKSSQRSADEVEGVTVLRPLKGVDCNLYDNLASSFRQDYPKFEVIFTVANANDPAIKVVQDLMKRYPKVDAKLMIGEREVGVNPKINNLIRSYEVAKYDILWILDSNVCIDPGCMGRSVDKLTLPGVGLVHHLPFAIGPDTFGSELEMMFIDTVHAKMYLAINFMGPDSCVVGKSCLYRKSDLESVGGLASFGKFMAEDNLIARALWRKGLKHEMTSDLACQPLGSMATGDYFLRRSRWTRIRKYTVLLATIMEPFTESIVCGLLASYGFRLYWNVHPLNFFAFHMFAWFMCDLSLFQGLSKKKIDVENLRGFIMAWALREITALPLYFYSVLGTTVDWRDGTFKLTRDSTVVKVASTQPGISLGRRFSFVPLSLARATANSSSGRRSSFFFQKPWVVKVITSIILAIDIVTDILFKSQRNGRPVTDGEPEQLKETNIRRRRWRDRTLRALQGGRHSRDADYTTDERETTNQNDPIIRSAGRYLASSLSRAGGTYFGIPYHDEPDHDEAESCDGTDPDTDSGSAPISRRGSASSASSHESLAQTLSSDNEESDVNIEDASASNMSQARRSSLFDEIVRSVSIGLSMHLQNEKNEMEETVRQQQRNLFGTEAVAGPQDDDDDVVSASL